MCGIIAMIGQRNVVPILLHGLHKLEYRGYDSSGISVINENQQLYTLKKVGKVKKLEQELEDSNSKELLKGFIGIAHTRWATHGKATDQNAHPHSVGDRISLVHNGIIENYQQIKEKLKLNEDDLKSDTDTEILTALIYSKLSEKQDLLVAVQQASKEIRGAFAIAVIDKKNPNEIIAMRKGSPLVIGIGIEENFIASDPLALQKVTQEFIYLEEGDVSQINKDKIIIYNLLGNIVKRETKITNIDCDSQDKGLYRHYMQKEIFEQPRAVQATINGRISNNKVIAEIFGTNASEIFNQIEYVQIVACGTSFYSGLVAKNWLESLSGIPCFVDIASEFRYRIKISFKNTLFLTISQSGETADTLSALRDIKKDPNYIASCVICNVPESSLVRESDLVFLTHAGPEIGVASTKGFSTQLIGLYLLACILENKDKKKQNNFDLNKLLDLPALMEETLKIEHEIKKVAKFFKDKQHALFLGRGPLYPLALEGAIKLKEISYIHAEGYPAGELKHGPLALVDDNMPVIVLVDNDHLLEKIVSNIQEVSARGGKVIVFGPKSTNISCKSNMQDITMIHLPEIPKNLSPIIYSIPMQLLAYHVAVLKGTDIDQPRNLAKSVTVE